MLSMHERRKSVSSASVIWYTILFRQNRTDRPVRSNGQVEGQITKLKLIKRTMYGRAGFALLRQRVLHTV
jgi:hypothetical protein